MKHNSDNLNKIQIAEKYCKTRDRIGYVIMYLAVFILLEAILVLIYSLNGIEEDLTTDIVFLSVISISVISLIVLEIRSAVLTHKLTSYKYRLEDNEDKKDD